MYIFYQKKNKLLKISGPLSQWNQMQLLEDVNLNILTSNMLISRF